jgi:phosphate acetyltransferase
MTEGPATLENRTFDEIAVGESASVTKTLTRDDIALFAAVSGDVNPIHLDERLAEASPLRRVVGHSLWGGGLISGLLGTRLPGPGTVYVAQDLRFLRPIGLGDTLTATVTVRERRPESKTVVFDCACTNQGGDRVIAGTAEVAAPAAKIRVPRGELPDVALRRHEGYERLIERCRGIEAMATAVGHPCDGTSLAAVVEAAQAGIIAPTLVGPEHKIRRAAADAGLDIGRYRLVDAAHSHEAAEKAVALVRAGEADVLMKGSLHTDELMGAVVRRDTGCGPSAGSAIASSWTCRATRSRWSSPTPRSTSSRRSRTRSTSSRTRSTSPWRSGSRGRSSRSSRRSRR